MRPIDRILCAAGSLFIAAWFLALAGDGIRAWFSGDDLMNLYSAWTSPVTKLLGAAIWFFGPGIRPLGSLWYRVVFALAGFHPLAFHASAFAILFVNFGLTYLLARRLSGRRETAAITTLLASYNARFVNLYYDTGAIYDVLCYCFYLAALLWHVRVRQQGMFPNGRQMGVFLALTVCALNAKEMAVTLPLVVGSYELIYHPPALWDWRALKKWMLDEGRGLLAAALVAGAFLIGKWVEPGGIVHAPGYRMVFTSARALSNTGAYLDHIFYQYGWFTPARSAALWIAMLAVAILSRSRTLRFAWLFLTVSLAPMMFIDPRAGSAIYVCLFGWALFATELAVRATDPLARWMPARLKSAALFLGIAALLWPYHRFEGGFTSRVAAQSGEQLRPVAMALHQSAPELRPGARLLFLNDPIRPDAFDLTFLIRLSYRDNSLQVDRVRMMPAPPERSRWSTYDYVFDYAGDRFILLRF